VEVTSAVIVVMVLNRVTVLEELLLDFFACVLHACCLLLRNDNQFYVYFKFDFFRQLR